MEGERQGMVQQGAQAGVLAWPPTSEAACSSSPHPSPTSSPCDCMAPNPVARSHLGGRGGCWHRFWRGALAVTAWALWRGEGGSCQLRLPPSAWAQQREVTGPCGQPRVQCLRWRKPFLAFGPSPTEFPVPSSSADQW